MPRSTGGEAGLLEGKKERLPGPGRPGDGGGQGGAE